MCRHSLPSQLVKAGKQAPAFTHCCRHVTALIFASSPCPDLVGQEHGCFQGQRHCGVCSPSGRTGCHPPAQQHGAFTQVRGGKALCHHWYSAPPLALSCCWPPAASTACVCRLIVRVPSFICQGRGALIDRHLHSSFIDIIICDGRQKSGTVPRHLDPAPSPLCRCVGAGHGRAHHHCAAG